MDDSGAGPSGVNGALSTSVLVLNKHYVVVRVVTARRAFGLIYKANAEVIHSDNGRFSNFNFAGWLDYSSFRVGQPVDHELFVRTPRYAVLVPKVIRLMKYDKVPKREVKFNRKNILARDENECQYCGRKYSASALSIDHVIPKSRGGKSTWTNAVAACHACNTRKGGRLPSEAGMKLIRVPIVPKRNPVLLDKMRSHRYELWRHFVRDDGDR